jgi:hypothetical protein
VSDELLQHGIRLFNEGKFFECHEVLEEAWTPERGPRRLFLQALIHFAVGCYQCERGNSEGAALQFRKGLKKIEKYLPRYEGVNTAGILQEVEVLLRQIEAGAPVCHFPKIQILGPPALPCQQ